LYIAESIFCSGKADGLYEVAGNCSVYYLCSNGETSVYPCPFDHLFIPDETQCLPPDQAPADRARECTGTPRY